MRLVICAVYDSAVEAFMQPFFVRSKGEAMRTFVTACLEAGSPFAKSPKDYCLYEIGFYDDDSGAVVQLENGRPVALLEARDAVSIGQAGG